MLAYHQDELATPLVAGWFPAVIVRRTVWRMPYLVHYEADGIDFRWDGKEDTDRPGAGWGLVSAAAPGVTAAAALRMPEVRPSLPPHRDADVIAAKLREHYLHHFSTLS